MAHENGRHSLDLPCFTLLLTRIGATGVNHTAIFLTFNITDYTMLRLLLSAFGFALLLTPAHAKSFAELFPQLATELDPEQRALLDGMDYQTGTITIGNNLASFELGEEYYFLGAEDASHVLVRLWGNPPSTDTLGMIFPIDQTPLHDTWGIELTYEEIGYVSDKDAADYDYDALLKIMQEDIVEENEFRVQQGYGWMKLIGWAERPYYDTADHKLIWAKELAFEGEESHTLNYNIRVLGRKGVLVINFIAMMDQLNEVRAATPAVLAMTSFNAGNRYSDFDSSVDTVAAVGIGGLIAGKVLAKTGFLAIALVFLKKFWFLALLPLLWLKNRLFNRRSDGS